MVKLNKDCLKEAKRALSEFTHDDLKEYANSVFQKIRSYENISGVGAVEKAIKEVNNETLESLFRDCQIKAKDISKYERLAKKIKEGATNLGNILIRRYRNLSDNLVSMQKSMQNILFEKMFSQLNEDEVQFLREEKNEQDIIAAVDGKESSSISKKIGTAILKFIDDRDSELVISDAVKLEHIQGDRFLRAIHDPAKMLKAGRSSILSALTNSRYIISQAKKIWKNFIIKLLNIKKTFGHTDAFDTEGNIDYKKIDEILDDIFENIIRGKSDIFTRSAIINDREQIQKKRRMFFHWKDFESSMVYNKKYGKGNLFEALMADIHSSGNAIAIGKLFGSSPFNMFLDLKALQYKSFKKEPKNLSSWFNKIDTYYAHATHMDQNALNPTFATFNANIRALTAMGKLFKVAAKSLPDIAYIAAYARRYGVNAFHSYGYALFNAFNLIKSDEERRYIANQFKLATQNELGYAARFSDSQNLSGLIHKFSMGYFRKIGLESFDKGNKISIMTLISKHLYNMREKSFENLSDELKLQLSKFDITSDEWNILKEKSKGKLFSLDNVNSITEDELKKLYDKSDKSISLFDYRQHLYNKVYSIFDVACENAVLSPSAFEKAWCYGLTKPGTAYGEILRHVFQFKMYSIAAIDRVIVQGFLDSNLTNSKLAWATTMFVGTLPLTILINWFDNISNGLSMPDVSKMTPRQQVFYGLDMIEPNFGIFMNLLDPDKTHENLLWAFLKSPAIQLMGDTLAGIQGVGNLDPDLVKKSFKHIANDILPLQVLPGASPYIREALGEKAYLQPGQQVLYPK